jgi:hypothetical protein
MGVWVRYAPSAPYVAGQSTQTFALQALAELRVLNNASVTSIVATGGGESWLERPRGVGETPPPGSQVRIDGGPWVPYTGQALP